MSTKDKGAEPKEGAQIGHDAELAHLRAQVQRLEAENALLRAVQPAAAADKAALGPAKEGHVWVYTKYPYVTATVESGRFRPESHPAGVPIQVTREELQLDRARRFSHLETEEEHEARVSQERERRRAPVSEHMAQVATQFAAASKMLEAREMHKAVTLRDIASAQRLAEQLPQ